MRARRALLYMPGNDWHKMEKAAALGVDSACLDLEDGVALNRKQEARAAVARALQELDFGTTERLVRVNAFGSGLEQDDLTAVLPSRPDGVVLPKLATAFQVRWASDQLAGAEHAHGWEPGSIRLLGMIESALGIVNLREIASADPRLDVLIFGSEDLAADVGATRTREATEVLYARGAVVTYAAAFGLQAIDLLFTDFVDLDALRADTRRGLEMGYAGKQVIHPRQVAPVQETYTPDAESVAHALRIVKASADYQAGGAGAFALDGKMVDRPIVQAAERVLQRARAAGKLGDSGPA